MASSVTLRARAPTTTTLALRNSAKPPTSSSSSTPTSSSSSSKLRLPLLPLRAPTRPPLATTAKKQTTPRPASRVVAAAALRNIDQPQALLFDCDGVILESEAIGHRGSFNAAFKEEEALKPDQHEWSVEEYGRWLKIGGGKERMDAYFRSVEETQNPYVKSFFFSFFLREVEAEKPGGEGKLTFFSSLFSSLPTNVPHPQVQDHER